MDSGDCVQASDEHVSPPLVLCYHCLDLLLIPGIEITTYRGHANLWGVRGWHEFRATNDRAMRQIRERARAR